MKKELTKKKVLSQNEETGGMPRRDFFKLLGGGIIIFFTPWTAIDILAQQAQQRRSLSKDYNAFLMIKEDGTVNCYSGKIEMGQGIITSLAQMMADELNVSVEKVNVVLGDTDLCPWDAGTFGSMTTRAFGPNMRAAAAEAKGVLLDLASAQLNVPASQLEVNNGVVTDTKNPKNSVTYAELTKGKKIERHLDVKPSVEDYTKFTYVGKPFSRRDAIVKVKGEAKYTGDLKIPEMVFARILRPPSHGAKLTSADTTEAEKVPGTKVIRDGDLVAVINEDREAADDAIGRIKGEYTFNEMPVNDKTIFDWMLKADTSANVVRTSGDPDDGLKSSVKTFESEFHDSFVAHVPIETHTAVARIEGDKITVWASTQTPFPLQDAVARELGMPLEKVRVIVPFVGGGFGGKGANMQAIEAARLTKLAGRPVMVVWSREEEFFNDTFHTAAVVKVNSGIDSQGMIRMWDYHVYFAGTRGADAIYNVPNVKITSYGQKRDAPAVQPLSTGAWRAPNNNTNTFAREVQVDIMAVAAGIDPYEFRMKNLTDEKMKACLSAVADKFGYTPGKGPSGRGIGISLGTDAGTWVAHMAEVKVDKTTGKVQVIRIACAQDMGLCVNPEGATIQMEGCLTMGLGYTLSEEMFFEGGKLLNTGFDAYEIPRFSWLPRIDTVILDRKDKAPQGGGEPAIIGIGAVVANAIFDATGARLYRMPMTPDRVLEALKKV